MGSSKVVIAGALGVVGRAVVERLADHGGIQIVAIARRGPDAGLVERLSKASPPVEWVHCDLQARSATARALAPHCDAARLVFAALYETADLARGWLDPDHVVRNLAMLRHTFDALARAPLVHVTLLQGTKAYGAHAGHAMRIPARETDAIRDERTFYFEQQDLLEAEAARRGFAFTIFRPQIVLGVAVGSAMNPVATLGAYAAILRDRGRPLAFPGHPEALAECVDARIIASAIEWSWREPRARNEVFNIANGDVVVWRRLFERLAREFELPLVDEPVALALAMEAETGRWRAIARRARLRIDDLGSLIGLSWQYAEMLWANPRPPSGPALVSTIKLRQAGFGECIDTETCVMDHLEAMRSLRYLPAIK